MRPKHLNPKSGCPAELTLAVMSGAWKPNMLYHLLRGRLRYMELARRIPRATQRMLTRQLRELEEDGLVTRHVFPEVPPRVEYEATPLAQTLSPILNSLWIWGEKYRVDHQGLTPSPLPDRLGDTYPDLPEGDR